MAVRRIITLPDSQLRSSSSRVAKVDGAVRTILDDMIETMYDAPGIGLAAVQVGVLQRLVVLDTARKDDPPQPLFLVNPEIVQSSDERIVYEEGCLSIPDYYEDVERPERVRFRFQDRDGAACEMARLAAEEGRAFDPRSEEREPRGARKPPRRPESAA